MPRWRTDVVGDDGYGVAVHRHCLGEGPMPAVGTDRLHRSVGGAATGVEIGDGQRQASADAVAALSAED